MRAKIPNGLAAAIAALAETQHGVVSRVQLLGIGMSASAIDRLVQAGRLWPIFRGVYAVGHRALRREGSWMAALITGGEGTVLSHWSAAAKWQLLACPTFPIHVTVTGDRGRNQPRIAVHRMRVTPTEVVVVDGLRVTTPARAIVDIAATASTRAQRRR